jgi:23S rRNA (uracil1939-C5)-methyltransferase
VSEAALGASFLVSPASFFQTNVAAAATLVRLVLEALPGESGLRVLDLYSGSGLFALPIALRGHAVTAVEGSRKAARDAELNRRRNGVGEDRLKIVCAAVEQALPRLKAGSFDAVVLDPPRDGCPPGVVRAVFGRLRPARGVLVSCDPEALARELPLAVEAGYRVLRVQPVDMFPHTPHVESVTVLERSSNKGGPGGAKPPQNENAGRIRGRFQSAPGAKSLYDAVGSAPAKSLPGPRFKPRKRSSR